MGTTISITQPVAPPAAILWQTKDLRPAGQTIHLSMDWKPEDAALPGAHVSTQAKVNDDGGATFVTSSLTMTRTAPGSVPPPGVCEWWIHDGEDFAEPPLGADGDHGTIRWDGTTWAEVA